MLLSFLHRKIIQGQKEGEWKGGKRQIPNPGQSVHVSHRGEVFQHSSPSARAKWRSLLVQRSAKVPPQPENKSVPPLKEETNTGTGGATSRISRETFPSAGLRSCSGPAFCPRLSARTDCEGAIGGVRGFPPVSIGTESHRGYGGGGARSPVPAPFLWRVHGGLGAGEGGGGRDPTFVNYAVCLRLERL